MLSHSKYQMGQIKPREIKLPVQRHTAGHWAASWDLWDRELVPSSPGLQKGMSALAGGLRSAIQKSLVVVPIGSPWPWSWVARSHFPKAGS